VDRIQPLAASVSFENGFGNDENRLYVAPTFTSSARPTMTDVSVTWDQQGSSAGTSEAIIPPRPPPRISGLSLFTWGRGEDGQLGLGDTSDQYQPSFVSIVSL